MKAVRMLLAEYSIIANGVMWPAVPQRISIIRMTLSALHTTDDVLRVVDALVEIDQRLSLQQAHVRLESEVA